MNCPNCGKPMEEGDLHTQKYPSWTQGKIGLFRGAGVRVEVGPTGDDDASMFTRDPFPTFPGAMLCRDCGLVCFTGKLIEKLNTKRDISLK